MKLSEIYGSREFALSFELFPPKTEVGLKSLYRHAEALIQHAPAFITCTYGAGGSTQEKTLEIVQAVKSQFQLPVASHLTCVGATQNDLREYLTRASNLGVDNIVALRGDPPKGETRFVATEGGLHYANELVTLIRDEFPQFGVAVAGYPEKHQEAESLEIDLVNLKRKVDCGADVVVTQLFYDNTDYFRFVELARDNGIEVPIVPGLMPVTNLKQIQRLTAMCGARLPDDFVRKLGEHDDEQWQFDVGVEFATEQVRQLIDQGVPGIHFYVLNKSLATSKLLTALGR